MAVESEEKTGLSFKLSSNQTKKVVNIKSSTFKNDDKTDTEKEYIISAEGKQLLSSKPKQESKKLIIPLIKKNNWRTDGTDLENEAVDELLKELREDGTKEVVVGPILMKNRLPARKSGNPVDEKYDISIRAEESTTKDYESIPISSFGSAMLRGMGWSEGKAIGLNNTGLAEPIEYIPRHKGLGLGAEKKNEDKPNRKRKLGEEEKKNHQPIVEKDGRVRHVKAIGEEVKDNSLGYFPGCHALIEKGTHKNLYGKIISVDADTSRLSVKLAISKEIVQISQFYTQLVDSDTYMKKRNSTSSTSKKETTKTSETKNEKHPKEDRVERKEPCWLMPSIRARLISQKYKSGKYYNKKVKILDVIASDICTCKTEEKKLLEDVRQRYLETVIPKQKGAYVQVVLGKHKGKLAKLRSKDTERAEASIELTCDKNIVNLPYDYLSEYLGELPDDEFL